MSDVTVVDGEAVAGVIQDFSCPFCAEPLRYDVPVKQKIRFALNADGTNNHRYILERVLAHEACSEAHPEWRAHWEAEEAP